MAASGAPPTGLPEGTAGGHSAATPRTPIHSGARRFFAPLLRVAWISYVLAIPLLGLMISIDIDFGGRWMCDPRPVGTLGVIHDRSGAPICQLEFLNVLLFWTLFAAIVSVVPIFAVYLRHVSRRMRRLGAEGDGEAQDRLSRRFFIDIGLCVLFAAAVGRGWPLSFVILPGAALAIYAYRFWRAARRMAIRDDRSNRLRPDLGPQTEV